MFSSNMTPLRFLLRLLVFLLVLTAVLEVWFRMVTPAAEIPMSYFDPRAKIDRFDPEGPSEGLFTVGRLARRAGEWRVNNAGWISAVDYFPSAERSKPLIAIFGDSYIEGFLSDVQQHVDVELQEALAARYDVYAFGKSGWYLEQYVATARYVSLEFQPSILVIFVAGDDVKASLRENGTSSAKWFQLGTEDTGFVEVAPTVGQSRLTSLKRAVNYSASARYLLFNAKLRLPWEAQPAIENPASESKQQQGNASAGGEFQGTDAEVQKLLPAAQFMVTTLCEENPGISIVFVGDGPRYLLSDEINPATMNPDVAAIQKASESFSSCHFLDLRRVFSEDWASHHRRFESIDESHWNPYGNQVVAQALAAFLVSEGLTN